MTEQIRCKNCGKQLNTDERENLLSFCSDGFEDYKSFKMRQGSAMRIFGIIILIGGS